ncbi:MAG: (Fe-S)-binding protein [Candidatus Jordarchaeum sp.]|uniref:(Fe-S)-binding protein n=1 Tax=Candidatus Jordarchaeum sp. TaxID=2823881 RepID=UPI004049829D
MSEIEEWTHMCTRCGTCHTVYKLKLWERSTPDWQPTCPAGEKYGFEPYFPSGRMWIARGLTEGKLDLDNPKLLKIIYSCTLCGNCEKQCQTDILNEHITQIIETLRERAVESEVGPPPKQREFGEWTRNEHNPYLEPHAERLSWLPFDKSELPEKADTVYFVGCTSSYRQKKIAAATANILKKLGTNFTILEDEWCCGSPLLRTGQSEIAKTCAEHNIEVLKKAEAKQVITSCAGCYRTLTKDYKEKYGLDYDFKVVHSPELFLSLIESGELELEKPVNMKVTYHDPCHIGRHMNIYDTPREILEKIPGVELVEMERNRENAWCCGAGGGVKSAFNDLAMFAAEERVKEALKTGADAIVSTCPFCWRNLEDAIEAGNYDLKMYDIVELIWESIK